jgi:hypothetical protein
MNESNAWAGIRNSLERGIVRTTNSGNSWERVGGAQMSVDVFSLAMDPTESAVLLAGTQQGIARTTNRGATWQWVREGGRALNLRWSANGSVVRAIHEDASWPAKLVTSTDHGSTWTLPPTSFQFDSYSFDLENPSDLVAVVDQACGGNCGYGYALTVRRSTNDGNFWVNGMALGCTYNPYGEIEVQGSRTWLWSASFLGSDYTLSRSDDRGATWTEKTSGMHEFDLGALDLDVGGNAYALTRGGSPRVSSDRAKTWDVPTLDGFPWPADLHSFQACRLRAGEAFEVAESGGSCDCGTTSSYAFRLLSSGETVTPQWGGNASFWGDPVAAANHGSGQVLYVWSSTCDSTPFLQRSDDGGQSWECLSTPFPVMDAVVSPSGDHLVYALARAGDAVRFSPDRGATWLSMSNGLPSRVPVRLLMNPTDGLHLLVIFSEGLPWESKDGGVHWAPLAFSATPRGGQRFERAETSAWDLKDAQIRNADWDVGADPARVFLATDRGIWISDFGMVDEGLPTLSFELIAYAPATGLLVAGSDRHCAFALDVPPLNGEEGARIAAGNAAGDGVRSALGAANEGRDFTISPNPFSNATLAQIRLTEPGKVNLTIFDAAGRRVRSLLSESLSAGMHSVSWDAHNDQGRRLAPGTYFLRLDQSGSAVTRRAVLLR